MPLVPIDIPLVPTDIPLQTDCIGILFLFFEFVRYLAVYRPYRSVYRYRGSAVRAIGSVGWTLLLGMYFLFFFPHEFYFPFSIPLFMFNLSLLCLVSSSWCLNYFFNYLLNYSSYSLNYFISIHTFIQTYSIIVACITRGRGACTRWRFHLACFDEIFFKYVYNA
jgi:hypothetical protein